MGREVNVMVRRMRESGSLGRILKRIDGRGYKAYKEIRGSFDFSSYSLSVDHVQGDPFASPSRLSVQIPLQEAGFPAALFSSKVRETAFSDFLARSFRASIRKNAKQRRGTGHSGRFEIDCGGQEVLERTSIVLGQRWIEAHSRLAYLPQAGESWGERPKGCSSTSCRGLSMVPSDTKML